MDVLEYPKAFHLKTVDMLCLAVASLALFSSALAGTTVWSGSFNSYPTVAAFDDWSWSNEVGEYQWYIHGTQPTSHYLALDPSYKNPADTSETNGLRVTIDSTATWNSQMERTELIPQTTANLGTGQMYYHFSIMQNGVNSPESTLEHQIMFFESHFVQLKYGVSPAPTSLQFMLQSTPYWSTEFTANTWFNFAYDINFSTGAVGLWASTGGDPLTQVVAPVSGASPSTNSEDFHVGVLRIVNDAIQEDFYVSGVYIESGTITTAIGSGSSTGGSSSSSSAPGSSSAPATTSAPASSSTPVASTSTVASATSTAAGATASHYAQCGGQGYTGPTVCASPYTCTVSNEYYSQCL